MAWAQRIEPAAPTVRFDDLDNWKMAVEGGAQATLQPTRAQNVWNRPVARLRYRGEGKAEGKARVFLVPPQPIELPGDADSVDMWVYGNRWDWEKPPGTPPVRLVLHLRDSRNEAHEFPVDSVRWQEWWLAHKKLPAGWPPPVRMERVEVSGGGETNGARSSWTPCRFYREDLRPLQFAARPRRATSNCLRVDHRREHRARASCLSQRASKRFCRCTWAEAIVTGWNLSHLLSAIRSGTAEGTAR